MQSPPGVEAQSSRLDLPSSCHPENTLCYGSGVKATVVTEAQRSGARTAWKGREPRHGLLGWCALGKGPSASLQWLGGCGLSLLSPVELR